MLSFLQKLRNHRATPNLIYLTFFFAPWLFFSPQWIDLVVAAIAIAIFIPVHYWSNSDDRNDLIAPIAITALIGAATAPFNVGHSVFHVYAAALSGFQPTRRLSAISLSLSMAIYLASASFFDRQIYEIAFGILLSVTIWIACLSEAEALSDQARKEREHALDKQQASLHERERIARDLHDLLGHTLTMFALKADIASRLIDTDPVAAKAEVKEIQTSARLALQDVRKALSNLTDTTIEREIENAETALRSAGVSLRVTGDRPAVSKDIETLYGLTIREAVTNIIRHSAATAAAISFGSDDTGPTLTITDNGHGGEAAEGNGLSGLRARIEAIGGAFSIATADGYSITARVPAHAAT